MKIRSFKYFYSALVCLFLHAKHEVLSLVIFLGFCSRKWPQITSAARENPRNFQQLWHSMFIMAVPALISSVLIYLTPTASISAVGPSCLLQPVPTDCNSLFPTYLYHSVTSDWYSTDKPTDCSSLIPSVLNSLLASTAWYSYDIIPVSGCRRQQAVTVCGVFACVDDWHLGHMT